MSILLQSVKIWNFCRTSGIYRLKLLNKIFHTWLRFFTYDFRDFLTVDENSMCTTQIVDEHLITIFCELHANFMRNVKYLQLPKHFSWGVESCYAVSVFHGNYCDTYLCRILFSPKVQTRDIFEIPGRWGNRIALNFDHFYFSLQFRLKKHTNYEKCHCFFVYYIVIGLKYNSWKYDSTNFKQLHCLTVSY